MGRAIRLAASLATGLGVLALTAPSPAAADGDPASDALIAQNVFYPYSSPVSAADRRRLNAEVATAHRAGIALKVALIAHRSDLGAVTAVYGEPQRYAAFLDTEISLGRRAPLLIVMRDGFGAEGLPRALQRTIVAMRPPGADAGTALAGAAIAAVARIDSAASAGHRAPAAPAGGPAIPARTLVLVGLILAALIVGGLLVVARVFFAPTA